MFYAAATVFILFELSSCLQSDTTKKSEVDVFLIGQRARVKQMAVGCENSSDLVKFYSLLAKDRDAAFNFISGASCKGMQPGTEGEVADTSAWTQALRLREKGQPDGVWILWGMAEHL